MSYKGRCACGQVTLAITGEPEATRQCWCRQCQKIAGGGPSNNAIFRAADVQAEGSLATRSYVADSGNTLTQWFCPSCGTHVYAQSSARLQFRTVRFGMLDEPHGLRPRMVIWTEAAPAWAMFDPGLEKFPRQQPIPPPPT